MSIIKKLEGWVAPLPDWPDFDKLPEHDISIIYGVFPTKKEAEYLTAPRNYSKIRRVLVTIEDLEPISYIRRKRNG